VNGDKAYISSRAKEATLKYIEPRIYADPDIAARKIIELANAVGRRRFSVLSSVGYSPLRPCSSDRSRRFSDAVAREFGRTLSAS